MVATLVKTFTRLFCASWLRRCLVEEGFRPARGWGRRCREKALSQTRLSDRQPPATGPHTFLPGSAFCLWRCSRTVWLCRQKEILFQKSPRASPIPLPPELLALALF